MHHTTLHQAPARAGTLYTDNEHHQPTQHGEGTHGGNAGRTHMDKPIPGLHTASEGANEPVEAKRVIRRSKGFTVINGELYKRSISGVLQRCIDPVDGQAILLEIHAGICGHHASSRADRKSVV